jgi:hypothetical protein
MRAVVRDAALVLAAFAIAAAIGAALGATSLGTALGIGQVGFAAALVYVLLRR